MIIDHIDNAHRYYGMHSKFKDAFEQIKQSMICSVGDAIVENSLVKTYLGLDTRDRDCLFEYHNHFIDIHVCLKDTEIIEFSAQSIKIEEENEEDDIYFSSGVDTGEVRLTEGQFAIFFTGELHKPQIGDAGLKVSKCVAKVRA